MPIVLVVDDSATDRRLIGGLLTKQPEWSVEFASNGLEAMSSIQHGDVDLVVTDLQMPEMDGLNLVQAIRVQYADLPVILITGQGSESLAVAALEYGAAGYVPKSQLSEMLPATVEDVWEMVGADRSIESLIDRMTRNEFSFELPNDLEFVDPLVDLVQQMVSGLGLCDAIGRVRIGIAVEQALRNAMLHGNLELPAAPRQSGDELRQWVAQRAAEPPYEQRRVFVEIVLTRDEAKFVVRDDGAGFDTSTVPGAGDPSALEREGGRGLVLMRTFMNEIRFNDVGNEVTMVKRRDEPRNR